MLGPIDYLVLSFEGNNFDGSVLSELEKVSSAGTVRVVDLVFVMKNKEGDIALAEVRDQPEELKETLGKLGFNDDLPLFTEDELLEIGESLEKDTSAAVLVVEHLWAKDLKKSLIDAGATVINEGRIHPEIIDEVVEDIEELMKEIDEGEL